MTAINGYILEGVSGVGKTRLLGALQAELARRRPGCTKLVLSEHYTDRILEDDRARGLVGLDAALAQTEAVVEQIGGLFALRAASPFRDRRGNAAIAVLVERFLGSHAAHRWAADGAEPTAEEAAGAQRQYATLADHGVIPLVLHTAPTALDRALAATRRHRNTAWSAYLDRLGRPDRPRRPRRGAGGRHRGRRVAPRPGRGGMRVVMGGGVAGLAARQRATGQPHCDLWHFLQTLTNISRHCRRAWPRWRRSRT